MLQITGEYGHYIIKHKGSVIGQAIESYSGLGKRGSLEVSLKMQNEEGYKSIGSVKYKKNIEEHVIRHMYKLKLGIDALDQNIRDLSITIQEVSLEYPRSILEKQLEDQRKLRYEYYEQFYLEVYADAERKQD